MEKNALVPRPGRSRHFRLGLLRWLRGENKHVSCLVCRPCPRPRFCDHVSKVSLSSEGAFQVRPIWFSSDLNEKWLTHCLHKEGKKLMQSAIINHWCFFVCHKLASCVSKLLVFLSFFQSTAKRPFLFIWIERWCWKEENGNYLQIEKYLDTWFLQLSEISWTIFSK